MLLVTGFEPGSSGIGKTALPTVPQTILTFFRMTLEDIWISCFEYETPRLVKIHNRKLGLVRSLYCSLS